jgi:hypothetical protein
LIQQLHKKEECYNNNNSLCTERKAEIDKTILPENGVMSWTVYEEQLEAEMNGSKNGHGLKKSPKKK